MTLNLLSFPDLLGKLSYSDSVFSDSLSPIRMTSTHTTFGSFGNKHIVREWSKKSESVCTIRNQTFFGTDNITSSIHVI